MYTIYRHGTIAYLHYTTIFIYFIYIKEREKEITNGIAASTTISAHKITLLNGSSSYTLYYLMHKLKEQRMER